MFSNQLKEKKMKKIFLVSLVMLLVLSTSFFAGSAPTASANELKILEFDTMVGNPPAFTGATNPIRGINGGGAPWTVGSASGELTVSGHLEITVQGLVLVATGSNPVASFRAIVSCLKSDGSPENLRTDPFPATTGPASAGGGNAKIEANLSLPRPCIAPIIFVTSGGGSWFAATGF